MNVGFPKADLASHFLWMCPHTWQDQFNLHKKGLNPMDMHSLLQCLEAIERVCTQERSNAQSNEKASTKNEKGNKRSSTDSTYKIPKKAQIEKHCDARNMGVHIPHTTHKSFIGTRKMETRNPISK